MIQIYGYLCGHKFGTINASKFCRLANIEKLTNGDMVKSDYDLLYRRMVSR